EVGHIDINPFQIARANHGRPVRLADHARAHLLQDVYESKVPLPSVRPQAFDGNLSPGHGSGSKEVRRPGGVRLNRVLTALVSLIGAHTERLVPLRLDGHTEGVHNGYREI